MLKLRISDYRYAARQIRDRDGVVRIRALAEVLKKEPEQVTYVLKKVPWLSSELDVKRNSHAELRNRYLAASAALSAQQVHVCVATLSAHLQIKPKAVAMFLKRHPDVRDLIGVLSVDQLKLRKIDRMIANGIEALRARNCTVTVAHLAIELGCARTSLTRRLQRFPELKLKYKLGRVA